MPEHVQSRRALPPIVYVSNEPRSFGEPVQPPPLAPARDRPFFKSRCEATQSPLAEFVRILPYWPRDRFLELAPAYWTRTRARLDAAELAAELGHISVPAVPLDTSEQPPPD